MNLFGREVLVKIFNRAGSIVGIDGQGRQISNATLVSVIDTSISDFAVSFEYKKYLDNAANKEGGSINIKGLSRETVDSFGQLFSYVELYVRYKETNLPYQLLFRSDIVEISFKKENGSDVELKLGSNVTVLNHSQRFSISLPPKSEFGEAIVKAFQTIGGTSAVVRAFIDKEDEEKLLGERGTAKALYQLGLSLEGSFADIITAILSPHKYFWRIMEDGSLLIQSANPKGVENLIKGQPTQTSVFNSLVLSASTGLIGIPSIKTKEYTQAVSDSIDDNEVDLGAIEKKQKKNKDGTLGKFKPPEKRRVRKVGVNIMALINASIVPNSVVTLDAPTTSVSGDYRVVDVSFKGDTRGANWFMEIFAENNGKSF